MDWSQFAQRFGFTTAILCLGLWAIWRVRRWLKREERMDQQALAARRAIMAVPTAGRRPTEDVKTRGARSIEARFTVHRRLILPLVAGGVLALASLPFLDEVPATALSLVVAIVTGVLGVAARPSLENAMSGLVMSFSKVIRVGDTVGLDEHYGTVEDISPTHTTIRLWDWRRYVVPNTQMLQSKLINYTLFDQNIWACVEFWLAHDADLELARQISVEVAETSRYRMGTQPAELWILGLDERAIRCWLVAWTVDAAAAWAFKDDVRARLSQRFREAGLASHGYRYVGPMGPPAPGSHSRSSGGPA